MSKTEFSFVTRYTLVITAVVLSLIMFSFHWFSYNKQRQVRNSLTMAIKILRDSDNINDYRKFAEDFKDVRVTVLNERGEVLADNAASADFMENHSVRPEFAAARLGGYGAAMRKSETTGKNSVYVATKLKNGTYVRLAQSTELTYEFLLWLFAPIIFLGLCIAALMFVMAKNRQIERMRQEFVANVSHELKTPLTSIKGFAELISTGLIRDPRFIKDYQLKIITQSNRLLDTINDILHLSKLESVKPSELVEVDTRAAAEQVKESLKLMADRKNIIIQVSGEGRITAEAKPVYHMIYNLVDNGIKYGKNCGYVKVVLSGKKITVIDNGIGIPEKDIERVFERFYRVDKSRSVERGGTGLGLAIVKHTVQKYNGTVTLKSGDGTQVFVEFRK